MKASTTWGARMDVEAQIAGLTRRVSALEKAAVEQERHNAILTELKENVAFLLLYAISTSQRIEETKTRLGAVETRLDNIALRRDIAEAMREVLREEK